MASHNTTGSVLHTPGSSYKQRACCSSPSSICYWCVASLAAWGLLSLIGIIWRPLHGTSAVTILLAAAIGCFANWIKNHILHCSITAWIFLAGAVVFLLGNVDLIQIEPRFVWPPVAIGTVIAFILEWRFASRPAR